MHDLGALDLKRAEIDFSYLEKFDFPAGLA